MKRSNHKIRYNVLCVFILMIYGIVFYFMKGSDPQAAKTIAENKVTQENDTVVNTLFDASEFNHNNYTGIPYDVINNNIPYFTNSDFANCMNSETSECYQNLDDLGRCNAAYAILGPETLPTEERGEIGMIKPAGWHTVKYKNIDGNYLYNRCHLIAFCLSGENANEKNLTTGTRYMNTEGMLPFELQTLNYIKETGNHVYYRSTPVFESDNLIAEGVLLEALSVEDNGKGLSFCVFCYNVQPGITIDYKTGESEGTAYE